MSVLKSIVLAATVVIGFATLVNAAPNRYTGGAYAPDAAATHFQNQFSISY